MMQLIPKLLKIYFQYILLTSQVIGGIIQKIDVATRVKKYIRNT